MATQTTKKETRKLTKKDAGQMLAVTTLVAAVVLNTKKFNDWMQEHTVPYSVFQY